MVRIGETVCATYMDLYTIGCPIDSPFIWFSQKCMLIWIICFYLRFVFFSRGKALPARGLFDAKINLNLIMSKHVTHSNTNIVYKYIYALLKSLTTTHTHSTVLELDLYWSLDRAYLLRLG